MSFPEELSDATLWQHPFRDRRHNPHKRLVRHANLYIVEFEKDKRGRGSNALISVHKRMVLNDMKEVGRGHLVDVRVKVLIAMPRHWHRKGRFQESDVANAMPASIAFDLITVDL